MLKKRSSKLLPSRGVRPVRVLACALWLTWLGCGTVDLGDNPEAVDLDVDENFFHCEVQPKILTEYRCASGAGGEEGGCHTARSALRLIEVSTPARCKDGRVIGAPPEESQNNLERVRTTLGIDAESSPFYRRPLGLDSHPRRIFEQNSDPAMTIRTWLNQGSP